MTENLIEQIIKDCIGTISCPLGKFYPNKNYGGRLNGERELGRLLAAARLAVAEMDGVYIKNGRIDDNTLLLSVLINNKERTVSINLEKNL